MKKNEGKPPLAKILKRLDPEFLWEMYNVLEWAAENKYEDGSWKHGDDWTKYLDAAVRHIRDFMESSQDRETGLCHLAHSAINCMFVYYFLINRKGEDDR